MPLLGNPDTHSPPKHAYFKSLEELDEWAVTVPPVFDEVLPLHPRVNDNKQHGRLLVCHDYKGGYTESPFALSYTFNFWSSCDTFIYFSHHRVTVPPPGWISASHRQGVKILGTLIFEGGGEQDCLRLLVGKLPKSRTGPVSQPNTPVSLPISPHYARLLADLARQRGFDGYLLNFECPLVGGMEQTRALAAWITLLQAELKMKVGSHAETMWYDSVIINGKLAWQDRLNCLNLPFFQSSSSLFSNYTWRNNYPSLTAQYFLSLDPSITGGTSTHPQVQRKTLQDIYMGVDVWGRGSHGNGGFGAFKAISHIAPSSLGLSVALFGQAWTWESEQDEPGWDWDSWWTYERKLWTGKADSAEEIAVPDMPPLKNGELPCEAGLHDDFTPLVSYFERTPPPDPVLLPFHTTFSPGVGRRWFVNGREVFHRLEGWTDVDKQTSLGDLVWPKPLVSWEGDVMDPEGLQIPDAKSQICMDNAWNGGSALRLSLSAPVSRSENAAFRCIWIPVQSLTATMGRVYEASAVLKLETEVSGADIDVALSVKAYSPTAEIEITPLSSDHENLEGGWSTMKIHFSSTQSGNYHLSLGLVITIITDETSEPLALSLLLGQMNVYPRRSTPHIPSLLWADFTRSTSPSSDVIGSLNWELAASLPPFRPPRIVSPDDPIAAWPAQPTEGVWFPKLLYANIYALEPSSDGNPGRVEDATWIGTSGCGYEGTRNSFIVERSISAKGGVQSLGARKTRFFVQGVTESGDVLDWDRCVFLDV
ncbi:glycoside hydrolase family 85 protein [Lentinula raphanica]|nr:glycoside hydrolase family 85 protein [Lentinula raphanica]